jgi:Xaa-Pro aminopeptidase
VRETGEVHVMSVHEDGIPSEIPRSNLYRFAWSPTVFVESIAAIPGVTKATSVAVDGMTPTFEHLLREALPLATFANGEDLMRTVRMVKSAAEVECIRTAVAVSESALCAVIDAIAPGVAERALVGVFAERMAQCGTTVPAADGTFCATPTRNSENDGTSENAGTLWDLPIRRMSTDRALREGELVALDGGVLYAGYEGGVGRTWPCGGSAMTTDAGRSLFARWRGVMDALVAACRAGRPASDLRAAHAETGEPLPPLPIAHGLGLGYEPPIIGASVDPRLEARFSLRPGMVLALQAYVFEEGTGAVFGREIVHLTARGPERLTTLEYGPLSRAHS